MTLLEALRQTLVDQNVQSVYLLSVSPEICPAVVLRPYASRSEIDIPIGRQSIQCFIRATSFPESEQIAWKCFKIFADLHHSNKSLHRNNCSTFQRRTRVPELQ